MPKPQNFTGKKVTRLTYLCNLLFDLSKVAIERIIIATNLNNDLIDIVGTQIKAALKVNSEQLIFNWSLGQELATRKIEEKWGSGIVEQVSLDLQNEFPSAKGFSTTNLWNMKKWYNFYSEKLQQVVGES